MMGAQQRMTQIKNTGVRPRPLVPITMLAVETGRTAKTIARHPPWEKDHVDKASPVGPAARAVHSFLLTLEIRESAEMANLVANMQHPLLVQVNDLSYSRPRAKQRRFLSNQCCLPRFTYLPFSSLMAKYG